MGDIPFPLFQYLDCKVIEAERRGKERGGAIDIVQ
jgi:hypothetical protein